MTLDEAIKHCLEVAEQNDAQAEKRREEGGEEWGKTTACRECAADHRQLAEWLTELKEWKKIRFYKSELSVEKIIIVTTVHLLIIVHFQMVIELQQNIRWIGLYIIKVAFYLSISEADKIIEMIENVKEESDA